MVIMVIMMTAFPKEEVHILRRRHWGQLHNSWHPCCRVSLSNWWVLIWTSALHKIAVYDDGAWPDCQRRWWWIVTLIVKWSPTYGNATSPRILDISTQGSPCVVASKNASVFFAQEPACDETLFDEHRKRNKQSNKNGQNIFCTLGCWCMWGWFKKLDVSWSSQTRKKHWRRPKQTRCNILDYNLLSV